jgi:hypothetical protein
LRFIDRHVRSKDTTLLKSSTWFIVSSNVYKGSDKLPHHLDTLVATDVAILAEEVVEGICLGCVSLTAMSVPKIPLC